MPKRIQSARDLQNVLAGRRKILLFTYHHIGLFEVKRERLKRHGAVVVQELVADSEEVGPGCCAANVVQELAGGSDPTPR